jgi:hypothetical protein
MLHGIKKALSCIAGLIACMSFFGCAGPDHFIVEYQVPEASRQLQGQMVRLQVADQRQPGSVLTPEAAGQFPQFSGIYNLTWIMPDQERILAGDHRLIELFKAIFEKRLTGLGVTLTDAPDVQAPLLQISLHQFSLDLRNHNWMAELNYNTKLTLEGHPIARENVHATAQRVRIIGYKGADEVLGDILTDAVNRLDLPKLFKNAGLIP